MATAREVTESNSQFLEEALELVRELVVLRNRLVAAQREHAELLQRRDAALAEGIDILPDVRKLHNEIEALPDKIRQIEQRVHWIVTEGTENVNAQSRLQAARQYMRGRESFRGALQEFKEKWIAVQADLKSAAQAGTSSVEPYNLKLREIETALGKGMLPRVTYQLSQFPNIDAELVGRSGLCAALDLWIGQLK
jgi:chromosome segregation ATPase